MSKEIRDLYIRILKGGYIVDCTADHGDGSYTIYLHSCSTFLNHAPIGSVSTIRLTPTV